MTNNQNTIINGLAIESPYLLGYGLLTNEPITNNQNTITNRS